MAVLRLAAPGWMLAGLACLALAAALIAVVAAAPSSVQPADNQWLRWMLYARVPPGVFVAKVLNVVAGGAGRCGLVRAAIAAALAIWRRWRALAVFALAELCAELCTGPVKARSGSRRLAGPLVAVTGQSMPSGHALAAAVTAIALALTATRPGRSRLLALAAAAAWSVLVALSRTYLSAHWLTDVPRQPAARDRLGSTVVRRAGIRPAHAPPANHRLPGPEPLTHPPARIPAFPAAIIKIAALPHAKPVWPTTIPVWISSARPPIWSWWSWK